MPQQLKTLGFVAPLLAGIVLIAAFLISTVIGAVYADAQGRELYDSLASASLYFASAVATSSTTVIALMLAMLSLTHRTDVDWNVSVYRRLRMTAIFGVSGLTLSIVLLLMISVPTVEAESIPDWWFGYLYPGLYWVDTVLAMIMVMTAGLLYTTLATVIKELSPAA